MSWSAYRTADDIGGTAFNGLSDGSSAISNAVDNSTDRDEFGDLEIIMGTAVAPSGLDSRIEVFLFPAVDGTNYPDPGDAAGEFTPTYYVGQISAIEMVGTIGPVSTFTRGILRSIELPPCPFKIGLINELGVAFNASVTLKLRRYNPA